MIPFNFQKKKKPDGNNDDTVFIYKQHPGKREKSQISFYRILIILERDSETTNDKENFEPLVLGFLIIRQ